MPDENIEYLRGVVANKAQWIASLQSENDCLRDKLRDEEERHAALQSRCYEGFPSASDGIFEALKETQALLEKKEREHSEVVERQSRELAEAQSEISRLHTVMGEEEEAMAEMEKQLAELTKERNELDDRVCRLNFVALEDEDKYHNALAQLAEAKRDAERWRMCEKHGFPRMYQPPPEHSFGDPTRITPPRPAPYWIFDLDVEGVPAFTGATAAEAIDAALSRDL